LVRTDPPAPRRRRSSAKTAGPNEASAGASHGPTAERALEMVTQTLDALRTERGDDYAIRGSLIKQTIKRRNPGFNERAHGFRAYDSPQENPSLGIGINLCRIYHTSGPPRRS